MRYLYAIIFISIISQANAQYIDSSHIRKMEFRQGFDLQYSLISPEIALVYNYQTSPKEGYKNYQNFTLGGSFNLNKEGFGSFFGYEIGATHNKRISKFNPLYFSMGIFYHALFSNSDSDHPVFDNYINAGRAMIGLNVFRNRLKLSFTSGLRVQEHKQDLVFSVHTYARFSADFLFKVGFFFDQKKD